MTKVKLGTTSKGVLSKGNLEAVQSEHDTDVEMSSFASMLHLFGEVFDAIANGDDMYMIIGATSNKSSYVLTVKLNGVPTSVYGGSITELALKAADLL